MERKTSSSLDNILLDTANENTSSNNYRNYKWCNCLIYTQSIDQTIYKHGDTINEQNVKQ